MCMCKERHLEAVKEEETNHEMLEKKAMARDEDDDMRQQENVGPCGQPIIQYTSLSAARKASASVSHRLCDNNNNHANATHLPPTNLGTATSCGGLGESLTDLTNRKKATAHELLAIIGKGDFDQLQDLLRSKPDLNVFIEGQTALHHCLLLGKFHANALQSVSTLVDVIPLPSRPTFVCFKAHALCSF